MGSLREYFTYYELPTGRRLHAMRALAALAADMGLTDIQELAEQATQQATRTISLESSWRRARNTSVGRRHRAGIVDAKLDRTVSGLGTQLDGIAHAFGEDEARGKLASQLLQRLFPEGVSAITSMSYENELAASEDLVADLQARPDDVAALGLEPYVERLDVLNGEFRTALGEESTREISYDQLREAQAEGQELMLRVVAKILGDFNGSRQGDVAVRQQLLAPLDGQQRRMREQFSSRRGQTDIDPDTGEELDVEDTTPATDVASASASAQRTTAQ